jgi:hypothetical protein
MNITNITALEIGYLIIGVTIGYWVGVVSTVLSRRKDDKK